MSNSKVVINDKGAEFLKNGQMWMYSNNLASDISHLENGSVVDIVTEKNEYLGTGYLCKDSHITVRIFSKKHETIDYDFFEKFAEHNFPVGDGKVDCDWLLKLKL